LVPVGALDAVIERQEADYEDAMKKLLDGKEHEQD
jgi:hypothetical protein